MLAETSTSNTTFLRHDLMIELFRLEMAMEDSNRQGANDDSIDTLQSKHARVADALSKLANLH
ncbi:MAG: hypothetical protein E6K53_05555 [Gammaproteobacteria bacterium]|nr:MAG: hypothetical protein E6K53_05555 [Gammaproteobacteria bacterium]